LFFLELPMPKRASPELPEVSADAAGVSTALADDRLAPPRRPTRARLQTYFLRLLARSGSVVDAAARAGVAPRTVRHWRATNAVFAQRYDEVLATRVEILEDLAMRRACGADCRPVFHRGKQVATVERHNDAMLVRVLARFDRLAGQRRTHRDFDEEVARRVAQECERLQQQYDAMQQGMQRVYASRLADAGLEVPDELSSFGGNGHDEMNGL
jgi:hypothetical protein